MSYPSWYYETIQCKNKPLIQYQDSSELNSAIIHLDEILGDEKRWANCESCKQEHVQLRNWLIELRNRRNGKA